MYIFGFKLIDIHLSKNMVSCGREYYSDLAMCHIYYGIKSSLNYQPRGNVKTQNARASESCKQGLEAQVQSSRKKKGSNV